MNMKPALVLGLALALPACAASSTPPPAAPVAAVSGIEAALAAAGHAVLACYTVPACSAAAPKAQIRTAYDNAYSAVTAAQSTADAGGSPDLTAATAAMTTLQNLIAQLPAPPA
jgi:hypothetical protein